MRRVLKSGMAIALAAAMVVTAAPVNNADAAKKIKAAKGTYTVEVGKSVTVKVKNAGKKKAVKWSTDKKGKKLVKIAKAKTKADKKGVAKVDIKGKKVGTAKITAKVGKKSCKFKVKVTAATVNPGASTAPGGATAAPSSNATTAPTGATAAPTGGTATDAPKEPTAVPTPRITATPRPTNTPSPAPKNDALSAHKLGGKDAITVDGKEGKAEWENAGDTFDLLVNPQSVRGTTDVKAATAQFMWADDAFYAIIKTDVAVDEVKLFIDEDGDATNKNAKSATATLSSDKKLAEVKIDLAAAPAIGEDGNGSLGIEVQIKQGSSTINYFDSITDIVYDADKDEWNFKDNGIKAGSDDAVLGKVTLLPSMAQATEAYFTADGAKILAAANLPSDFEELTEGADWTDQKTKTMTFVDTKYWTDAYTANGSPSIFFTHVNSGENIYNTDPEHVALATRNDDGSWTSTREQAQGYIIWDKDYLYVLFDVADTDISPANSDHYTTDSTEFFLDEDYSRPAAYSTGENADEVQLRVEAASNIFSSNSTGTGNYELVAHAVKSDEKGYQVEYIIKLHNQHKHGDMMGMDLQINDCYTVAPTEEGGEATAARAATLTAYDTTNNCYQYPNVFGRVKLINKDEAGEEEQGEDDPKPTPKVYAYTATKFPADTEITIDGLTETVWNDIPSYTIGDDFYALVKLAWDDKNLYVYESANDSDFDSTASADYQRDGGEVFLDEDNSKEDTYAANTDAFQYRLTGFDAETTTTDGFTAGSDAAKAKYAGIETAGIVLKSNNAWAVEYRIPWASAKKAGDVIGFEVSAFDCSGGKRNRELTLITGGGDLWQNPSLFGEVQLVAAETDDVEFDLTTGTGGPGYAGTKPTTKKNDDGSIELNFSADASDYSQVQFTLPEAVDLTDYSSIVIELAEGSSTTINVSLVDAERKDNSEWHNPLCPFLKYGQQLKSGVNTIALGSPQGEAQDGNPVDFKAIKHINFFKGTEKEAHNFTIKSIKIVKK